MKHGFLSGVITASLTPLSNDLNINHDKLFQHCNWLMNNGNNGVLLMGTTGEANSFSVDERIELLEELIDRGFPAKKLMVGTGCCNLPETVKLSKHAQSIGVGGVLLLPPFYYKNVSDKGLKQYFDLVINEVADNSVRFYLYHFPKMSMIPFSLKLLEDLISDYPENIIGIKDSGGDFENMKLMIDNFPGFHVFAGTERYLNDILNYGGAGSISASTNLTCNLAGNIYKSWQEKNVDELQNELNGLRGRIEKFPMISIIKQVWFLKSGEKEWLNMRPPNIPVGVEALEEAERLLKDLEI